MMFGTIVNFLAIIIGSLVGLFFNKEVSEQLNKSLMNALALGVIYIGITGVLTKTDGLLIIVALVIGTFVGEYLKIDDKLHLSVKKIETRFKKGDIAEGLISAILLFCIGAMSILGAIEAVQGQHDIYLTKSVLDGVTAIMLATTLGFGVLLSAFVVLAYQFVLIVIVSFFSPIFTELALVDIGVLGGIMMIALGLNVLGITKIKVANMLPALLIPILWHLF